MCTSDLRLKLDLLNGSRRARIAAGAGVTVTEVNQLMKKYGEARKMVKRMMPAIEERAPKRGKKQKKGSKKSSARRLRMPGPPGVGGVGGVGLDDLKKIQDLMKD